MFNLKVGSVVCHKGVKRQVTRIVRAFDENFLILEGFPFIVRSGSVKPVIRTDERSSIFINCKYSQSERG